MLFSEHAQIESKKACSEHAFLIHKKHAQKRSQKPFSNWYRNTSFCYYIESMLYCSQKTILKPFSLHVRDHGTNDYGAGACGDFEPDPDF